MNRVLHAATFNNSDTFNLLIKIIMKETGTVKFFNASKGFGFITSSKGKDYFIHVSELNGIVLNDGAKVEFESRQGKKGLEAFNVSLLS